MSLDISLYDKDDQPVAEMNWLRNQYGLAIWAEDNTVFDKHDLRLIINKSAYAESVNVDRKLFKETVLKYWDQIKSLEKGYFYFKLSAYRQFIEGRAEFLPGRYLLMGGKVWAIDGSSYDKQGRIKIPVEHFSHPVFDHDKPSLEKYKEWFYRLVEFAELLQNKDYSSHCTN